MQGCFQPAIHYGGDRGDGTVFCNMGLAWAAEFIQAARVFCILQSHTGRVILQIHLHLLLDDRAVVDNPIR